MDSTRPDKDEERVSRERAPRERRERPERLPRTPRDAPKTAGNGPPSDQRQEPAPQRPVGPAASSGEAAVASDGFDAVEMAKNAPGSFATNVKAVLWDLPKAVIQNAVRYARDPASYVADVKLLINDPKSVMRVFKDDYVDFYGEGDFGAEVTRDPFRFVSDLAGAAAIGGGLGAKGATIAARATRVANPGAAKVLAGAGRVARGVSKVERIDPSDIALRALGKIYRPMADGIGYGETTPAFKVLDSTIAGEGEREAAEASLKMWTEGLTPVQNDKLIRALSLGKRAEVEALKATDPVLHQKYLAIREALEMDSAKFLDETGAVSDPDARRALYAQIGRYEKQLNKADVDMNAAKAGMDSGEYSPTFLSIHGPSRVKDFFSALNDPLYHAGTLGRAIKRAIKGEVPTDVHAILAHQMRASIGARGNIKLVRSYLEYLKQKGMLFVVRKDSPPEMRAALQKKGYVLSQGAFFESYSKMFDKSVQSLADAMRQPGDPIVNVANRAEQLKQLDDTADAMLSNPVEEVWIPRHAQALMNMRLNPGASDSTLGKAVSWALNAGSNGGLMPYYKAIATVLNPRYWIANAVGDAALAMLYGLHPSALKYAHKLRDVVPDEIADIPFNKLYQSQYNRFTQWTNRLQHYAQGIDNLFKRAMWIQSQAVDGVKRKLLTVGHDFFVAEAQLVPHLMMMKNQPNAWVKNLEAIARVKERMGIAGLAAAEERRNRVKLGEEYASAAAKEGPKGETMAAPELMPGKREGRVYDDPGVKSRPEKGPETAPDPIYGSGEVRQIDPYKTGQNDYRFNQADSNTAKQIEKALHRLDLEIETLKALMEGSESRLPYDPRDFIPKGTMDMIEALAFNPASAQKYVAKRLALAERLRALPQYPSAYRRKKPVPGDTMGWEQSGFPTGKPQQTSQYDLIEGQTVVPASDTVHTADYNLGQRGEGRSFAQYDYEQGAKDLTEGQQALSNIASKLDQNSARLDQIAADQMWHLLETRQLERLLPQSERLSRVADAGIDLANRFYGSYSRLLPWEKKIVRQFIPFYTFTKAMTQLAFRWPFMMPRRQFVYLNLQRAWQDIMEDNYPRSSWAKNLTPVATLENGDIIAIRDGSFNPMAGVRTTGFAGLEVPTAFDIFGQNPVVRLLLSSRGQITPKPLTPGHKATRLDNGEVWEWTGRGWKRVVLQPSFAKQLWSLFPQSQIIDALMISAVQDESGFALRQSPLMGPNGPVIPIGWQERLLSTVLPATRINPQQLEQRELGKIRQIVESLQDDLKRSSPEKRERIMTILRKLQSDTKSRYELLY